MIVIITLITMPYDDNDNVDGIANDADSDDDNDNVDLYR